MHKRPLSATRLRRVPTQFSWVDQRLVREHWIDHLSHEACALYLFLVTVADAPGLSYYADVSLCHRLSMAGAEIHQARQALIQRGLVPSPPSLPGLSPRHSPQRGPLARLACGC